MKLRFVELAKRAARHSQYHMRVGAVITRKNQVLSLGFNKPSKTHPRSRSRWSRIHAELDAILGVPLDALRGSSVYVVRLTKAGLLAMSRPCSDCMVLLKEVGVRKVYYVDRGRVIREEAVHG